MRGTRAPWTLLGIGIGFAVLLGGAGARAAEPPARQWPSGRPSPRTTWTELVRSSTAERLGFDNTPPITVWPALKRLAVAVIEPLRAELGEAVEVSSAYRSPSVNAAVGGTPRSAHLRGQALDLVLRGHPPATLAAWIERLGIPFDKLIVYPSGPHAHVHVRLRSDGIARGLVSTRP